MTLFEELLRDESGNTATEYGIIAAGVTLALLVSLSLVSSHINNTFRKLSRVNNTNPIERTPSPSPRAA